MIQSRIINNSLTEIYSDNYITQTYPTNFHSFFKRKILLTSENIDDYKEVTESEKTSIENNDAKWVEPPQSFIDMYDTMSGSYGTYNSNTGYFELNTLTDLTYEETRQIVKHSVIHTASTRRLFGHVYTGCRTFFVCRTYGQDDLTDMFAYENNLEVIRISTGYGSHTNATGINNFILNCSKLKTILGNIYIDSLTTGTLNPAYGASNLETLYLYHLQTNLNMSTNPKLNLDCIVKLIENRSSIQKNITITVHPDIYSKISDETNEEWHQLVDLAANKNITFVTNG